MQLLYRARSCRPLNNLGGYSQILNNSISIIIWLRICSLESSVRFVSYRLLSTVSAEN